MPLVHRRLFLITLSFSLVLPHFAGAQTTQVDQGPQELPDSRAAAAEDQADTRPNLQNRITPTVEPTPYKRSRNEAYRQFQRPELAGEGETGLSDQDPFAVATPEQDDIFGQNPE